MEKIVRVECHHCGESLTHPEKTVAGSPALHFKAIEKGTNGPKVDIFLSAKFNDFRKAGHKFPKGTVVRLFCPHCEEEFKSSALKCATCGENLIIVHSENGTLNITGICRTVGCLKHKTNEELPTEPPIASA